MKTNVTLTNVMALKGRHNLNGIGHIVKVIGKQCKVQFFIFAVIFMQRWDLHHEDWINVNNHLHVAGSQQAGIFSNKLVQKVMQ